MREDEPLEGWLFLVRMWAEHGPGPQPQERSGQALGRLAQALAAQPEGKVNYDRISGRLPSVYVDAAFSAAEALEAQRLYPQVWERGGTGSTHVAEGLLQGIALALQVDEQGEETIVIQPPDGGPVADGAPDEKGAGTDYGDSHEFAVTVLRVEPAADGGTYPRVIESKGEAPRQYLYEDDDLDDDDDASDDDADGGEE